MKSLHIDHGSPMNAVLKNKYTRTIAELPIGKRPKRVVIISAHWLTSGEGVSIGAHLKPPMIYDMYGFPDELYTVDYPVSGDPHFAETIQKNLVEKGIKARLDPERGIDHGVWSVLLHLFPNADIPVIPISVAISENSQFQYTLGEALENFLDDDTLIISSGNITHNLRELDWNNQGIIFPWAHDFDMSIENAIKNKQKDKVIKFSEFPGSRQSVPTPDHFYPFLTFLGSSKDREIMAYHKGFEMGSLSTRIYFS